MASPKRLFCLKVDKVKYPNVKQEYRFELINIVEIINSNYSKNQ